MTETTLPSWCTAGTDALIIRYRTYATPDIHPINIIRTTATQVICAYTGRPDHEVRFKLRGGRLLEMGGSKYNERELISADDDRLPGWAEDDYRRSVKNAAVNATTAVYQNLNRENAEAAVAALQAYLTECA